MALSSCSLIGSIQRDCRGVGSVMEIKVKVLPTDSTIAANYTVTSGTVAIASGSRTGWYTWYMEKETALFESVGTSNVANGTWMYAQTGKIILNRMSAQLYNELTVAGKNTLQIAVKTADGTYMLFGYQFGMDIATSKGSTGTTKGDRNGYEIDFVGSEIVDAPFMSQASYEQLITV